MFSLIDFLPIEESVDLGFSFPTIQSDDVKPQLPPRLDGTKTGNEIWVKNVWNEICVRDTDCCTTDFPSIVGATIEINDTLADVGRQSNNVTPLNMITESPIHKEECLVPQVQSTLPCVFVPSPQFYCDDKVSCTDSARTAPSPGTGPSECVELEPVTKTDYTRGSLSLSLNLTPTLSVPQLDTPSILKQFETEEQDFDLISYLTKSSQESISLEDFECKPTVSPDGVLSPARVPKSTINRSDLLPQISNSSFCGDGSVSSRPSPSVTPSTSSECGNDVTLKRKRNNISSANSRLRKKQKMVQMEEELRELTQTNSELKLKAEMLESLVRTMKELLIKKLTNQ